jgi:hypothetical protein
MRLCEQQPALQNHDLILLAGVLRCNHIVTELDLSHNSIKAKVGEQFPRAQIDSDLYNY